MKTDINLDNISNNSTFIQKDSIENNLNEHRVVNSNTVIKKPSWLKTNLTKVLFVAILALFQTTAVQAAYTTVDLGGTVTSGTLSSGNFVIGGVKFVVTSDSGFTISRVSGALVFKENSAAGNFKISMTDADTAQPYFSARSMTFNNQSTGGTATFGPAMHSSFNGTTSSLPGSGTINFEAFTVGINKTVEVYDTEIESTAVKVQIVLDNFVVDLDAKPPNQAPEDIILSNSSVSLGASANAVVGILSSDEHYTNIGDTHTYSLVPGVGDTYNSHFNISGGNLRANNPSTMAEGFYSIRLRTTDQDNATFDKVFSIILFEYPPITIVHPNENVYQYITNVTFGNINNNSTYTGTNQLAYEDYTAQSTDLALSSTTQISVSMGGSDLSDGAISVFIDWNQDKDFADANEVFIVLADPSGLSGTSYTSPLIDIVVPAGATIGQTRMRVASDYNRTPFISGIIDYGEAEDYTINVVSGNTAPTISTSPNSITVIEDIASSVNLSSATFADADGDSLTVTLTSNSGTLASADGNGTFSGVTISSSGTGTMTLAGTAANINTYLDTTTKIKYSSAVNDTTTRNIEIKANDGTIDSVTSNVSVNITDIADIVSDAVPMNKTYKFSDTLDFSISFDESVSVTGIPRISLDVGGTTKYATFISGNATATSGTILTFRYTVEAGLVDSNGIIVTNSVDLNGGSIVDTDADGSGADLSNISFASTVAVLVDGTAPSITAVSISNSAHKVSDTVTATITVTSDSDDYTTGSGAITGTINGYTLGSLSKVNDTTYIATFTITDGGTDVAAGSNVAVNFTLTDSSGNTSGAFTTAISQVNDAFFANLPDVDLTANTNTIAEDGGVSILTATLSGSLNNQWPSGITVNLAYTGTATAGIDYNKSNSIVVAAGNSSNTATITATADTLFDAAVNETAIVDISSVSVGSENGVQQQTITITDAEIAPTVTLSVGSASVAENGGTSTITATLSHATYDNTVVNTSYSGTAIAGGTDYNTPSSSITINAGALTANAVTGITAVDDGNSDGNLTIIIDVDSVTGSASENGTQQQTVTIIEDDNTAPSLTNVLTTYTITEDVASAINLSAATFSDTEGDNLIVALAVNSGTIASIDGNGVTSNVTIANSGTSSMTIAGTIAHIHTYLDTVSKIVVTTATNSLTDITLTVTPNDGVLSGTPATSTLSVTSVNDEPTLTATASNPTFTENGSAANLYNSAAVSTIESGQAITTLIITVTNVDDTSDEILNLDGSAISLVDGNGTTATNSFGYSVVVVGTTATVTLSGGSVADASMQTLVNAISYQNNSETPTTSDTRIVSLTSISDDGGTANGGDFVAAISVSSTVTVVAVNDIPVITNLDGDSFTYNEDSSAVIIDQGSALTLTDIDSADFDGGKLTVTITSGEDAAEDLLSLSVAGTVSLVANTAGANVSVDNMVIGTLANNIAEGNDLVINLNANATPVNIQTLLRSITYSNTDSGAPTTGARNVRATVTDGDGGTSVDNDVTITVAGVNDAANIGGDIAGGTIEDNGTDATGLLTVTDVDTGESTFTAQTAKTTTYGIFSINTAGSWTYTLDNTKANVQALPNNGTMTDVITIASADGTQQQITITITGVNGVATITGTSTGAATEDNSTQITGNLSIMDEDTGEAVFVAQANVVGTYGVFTLASNGHWTYDLDNTNTAVQALIDGGTLTDSFTATSADGTDSQVVTVTITGVNGVATITGTSTGAATEDNSTQITGNLSIMDEDTGEAVFVAQANVVGTYGVFTLASNGHWTYDLDNTNTAVQALIDGGTLTDSFTATSADGTDSQVVTVTITGVNGVATITGTSTGAATEDNSTQITGNLSIMDEDTGEAVFVAQANVVGTYGVFTLASNGHWTYDLDNTNTAVQALIDGGTLTDSFTATSADGTDSQVVTVTITGVNGVATITGTSTGAATEDNSTQITGNLSIMDEDTGEAVFVAQANVVGTYGVFTLASNGHWTYDLDNTNTAVQALIDGGTLTDSFTAASADSTDSQVVTVTITGVNGVATITGTSTGAATEDDGTQITGSLSITDEDTGEAVFVAQTDNEGSYGFFSLTLTGNWSYQLDNSNLEVQILPEGETLTDRFTVNSVDGTDSQVVTITITGINDTATITGTSIADTNEDNTAQVTGSLSITDKDTGEAIFMMQTGVAGTYGTFNIDNQGNWTFTLDNDNTEVQQMSSGEQLTDSFTVMSIDGTDSQVITVTVFGANDAPNAEHDEITVDINAENVYVIDVLANDSDVDGDALSIVGASTSLGTVITNGESLTLTTQADFVGQVSLTYTITDGNNAFSETTVDVNITGALNETAPVITVPETVEVNAEGLFTKVDLGVATALNSQGQPVPISLVDGEPLFKPGNSIAYWKAIDPKTGLITVASQKVIVHPIISLGKDQVVAEGQRVRVNIILNGEAPKYPVSVMLNISGSVDESDYVIETKEVTIESGTQASVMIDIVQDNTVEDNETLVVNIDEGNVSDRSSQVVTIVDSNIAPKITLSSSQNAETRQVVTPTGGLITIKATVSDPNGDNVSTQWLYDSALSISEIDADKITLNPAELSPGVYSIGIKATDDGEGSLSTTQTIYLEVIATLAVLTNTDSDGDLIPDNEEGYGDNDQDGIPDFQDAIAECNVMPEQILTQDRFLVEGEPGVCLRKGNTLAASETGGLQLTDNDLKKSIGNDEGAAIVGGVFDYIVTGLPQSGQKYQIVLPQRQPIPAGAVYRKYSNNSGWGTFVEDESNQLHSTAGEQGYCPPPASTLWSTGLSEGHWCVQLTIEDGGPNDNDGLANGTIVDPGGVAVLLTSNIMPVAQTDTAILKRNESIIIDVLENDSDADGDTLSIGVATATFGSVTITADNKLNYQSKANFIGQDTITYSLSDGNGGTGSSTVSITVYANDIPIAVNDSAETDDRTEISINVLANDTDADNDSLTVISATVDEGSVTINVDNTLTYTPVDGFDGIATIAYTIDDGQGEQAIGQVRVTVKAYQSVTVNNKSKGGSMGLMVIALTGIVLYRLRRKTNIGKKQLVQGASALVVATSMSLAAAEPQWFMTGSVGKSHANSHVNIPSDIGITESNLDKFGNSYTIGGGVNYGVYSFTLSYEKLGDSSASYTGDTLDTALFHQTLVNVAPKLVDGISLQGQYTFWQDDTLSASIGAGLFAWELDYTSKLNDSVIKVSEDDIDFIYNLQIAYAITEQVQVSLKASRYSLSINDINNLALGLTYHF